MFGRMVDTWTCDARYMATAPHGGGFPWCPYCRQPLSPRDIGRMPVEGMGIASMGLAIIYCGKCGAILGPATGTL